ncbi:MAG: hypothetical protein LBG45_05295 [Dysgonamonadaceae bacterium]|nr:hypothetical protein [Dysgonamonadaceae bacterium]
MLYTKKHHTFAGKSVKTVVKRRYISLIFTANLLLLVFSVIPHHHHSGMPHFIAFENHRHDCADDDRHNQEEKQTCLFEQNIDAVYEHAEEKCGDASCVLHHPELFLQAAVFSVFSYDFSLVRETFTLPEPPYLISYHCDFAGSGRGLRAPPMG